MCLLMHFCNSKIHFHQLGPFKSIKTMLKSLNVCKVYLQCGIIIQRVVTIHGVHSNQLSRMMNLKIEFARSDWVQFGLPRLFQLLELIQQESIIKTLISCDFTI